MDALVPAVFVVDDEASVRSAVSRLLRSAGLEVASYSSAEEFLAAYGPERPGCLLLDVEMPGLSGLELQERLAASDASLPIIFLTGHAGIPETVKAMKGGAIEFLTKPVDDEALLGAIYPALEKDRLDRIERAERSSIRARLDSLTPREAQVLGCIVEGKLNKQTAAELGTVEKTIKAHRARVMEKMKVRSVAELVRLVGRVSPGFDS